MELRRKTTWESSLNKIKTETYKSHNLQPLACPTTEGNSENKIKTETSSLTIYSHWLVPQLREILKIKLRLKLTSLTIYTHHFFLRRRPNIFPHTLLTWSLLTKHTTTQPKQRKILLLFSKGKEKKVKPIIWLKTFFYLDHY